MDKTYWVYMLTNKNKTTLYIGVTGNIYKRLWEHQEEFVGGFTKKYKLKHLIFVEQYNDVYHALIREKQLKKWNRKKKEWLISLQNPNWEDIDL